MSTTLLEEYIESGNGPAIEDLLNSNPKLAGTLTSHQMSPLLLSCYYNKPQLARLFIKHLDHISLHEAAGVGLLDTVMEYVERDSQIANSISSHGFSVLGIASHFGKEDIVRYLLSKHADPNLPSQNGYQVYPIHAAVSASYNGIAKLLVEAGAEVNVFQAARITPLHLAAQKGDIDMIILLLERGAMVEIQNDYGQTASDMAQENGFTEIAGILKT